MENETLKLTNVLADPTRFAIYQHTATAGRSVNVQEIADKFGIHPNVARLHLTKLEDVRLLKSETEKTGKGGRPSRVYELSEEVISLQFPPRDYKLLARIAIESLLSFGDEGKKALREMGKRFGVEAAKQAMMKDGIENSIAQPLEKKIESIQRLVIAQGLQPNIDLVDENTIRFRVSNCIFHDTVNTVNDHNICQMHQHLLEGIFETYIGSIDFMQECSIAVGEHACQYTMVKLPVK